MDRPLGGKASSSSSGGGGELITFDFGGAASSSGPPKGYPSADYPTQLTYPLAQSIYLCVCNDRFGKRPAPRAKGEAAPKVAAKKKASPKKPSTPVRPQTPPPHQGNLHLPQSSLVTNRMFVMKWMCCVVQKKMMDPFHQKQVMTLILSQLISIRLVVARNLK
jgi:hypothetical protein